jgi:NAD(P)-dependent dehydrogenase (short-subunit alcohol dehydrogenase family)
MRPLEENVVFITGATDGLGRGVARDLASRGAQVLLHGRDRERLDTLAREIGRDGEPAPAFLADFASLDEVRALADEVERSIPRLHVLINNAGIGSGMPDGRERRESRDGYELRLAVNHLAGFLLTMRLLPLLRRSAPARVVFVASLGQAPMDFDDPMLERGYSGTRAYGQSKLAQISFGFELAQRLGSEPITVTSLHPATFMPTKIVLEEVGHSIDTLEEGVESIVRLATAPELEGVTRSFFDRQAEATPHAQAYDPDARRRLWNLSAELAGEDVSRLFPHASSERE